MDIALVITDITGVGGIERTTSLLANEFIKNGHRVTIVSLYRGNDNLSYDIDSSVDIIYLLETTYLINFGKIKRLCLLLKTRNALHNYLKNNNHDEIICQAFLPTFLVYTFAYIGRITACEHFKYGIYNRFVTMVRDYIYKRCKRLVTLTEEDSLKFKNAGVLNSVIPNMVSFKISANFGQSKNVMVTAGRLCEQKGFDLLLIAVKKVFEKYPNWRLKIFGKGDLLEILQHQTNELGINSNVEFCGYRSDLECQFRNATFYVMSSRYEGFPMILLEAVSQSLPCVSFDCPEGPSTILRNGGGLLVENGNIEQLSNEMIRFIESPSLREKCARQALVNIKDYTPEKIYSKWMALFSSN